MKIQITNTTATQTTASEWKRRALKYQEQYFKVCDVISFPPDAPFEKVINQLKQLKQTKAKWQRRY